MTTKYSCEKCGMGFKQKSHHTQHINRKIPCIKDSKLKEYIDKVVEDKINTLISPIVSRGDGETTPLPLPSNEIITPQIINYEIKSMRYLGNKTKHLEFIYSSMVECMNLIQNKSPIIFDAFGGTGSISQFFNYNNYRVVSNDINNYSYKLCFSRNSITKTDLTFEVLKMNMEQIITLLNNCKYKGFIYNNYSPNPQLNHERKYFTNENAEIIDGIRTQIEEWIINKQITNNEYIFLVALLIECVSLYSNIPGTYGAFNTNWDSRSTRKFKLDIGLVNKLLSKYNNQTFNRDVREIISIVDCDILYLDPPYNERDYSMYYHVLETISLYNNPELNNNKTGTKKVYNKSKWCIKPECKNELEYLIKNTKARCIILSYNNEGIISIDEIEQIFKKYGTYIVKQKLVKRFKCNDTNDNDKIVYEYLHILIKIPTMIPTMIPENTIITANNDVIEPQVEINTIYNCCCIEGMKKLPENCIDLICTDLPYGLTECKWDTPINLTELWTQYKRILKQYGTIILFGQQPFTSRIVSSNYEMFKFSLVWQKSKPGGFAQAPYKVLCEHEDILVFSYGKTAANAKNKMIYNPQGTIPCNKVMKGKTGATEHRGNRKTQDDYVQTTTNYPRSILKFNNEGKTKHPTQKPIELIKYLINTYSNEGNVVLDSCMGSGTTAIASIETKRQFIGYELEKKYFDICTKRITEINKG